MMTTWQYLFICTLADHADVETSPQFYKLACYLICERRISRYNSQNRFFSTNVHWNSLIIELSLLRLVENKVTLTDFLSTPKFVPIKKIASYQDSGIKLCRLQSTFSRRSLFRNSMRWSPAAYNAFLCTVGQVEELDDDTIDDRSDKEMIRGTVSVLCSVPRSS